MTGSDLILPSGMSLDTLLAYIVGLGAFISIVVAYHGMMKHRARVRRVESAGRHRSAVQNDASRYSRSPHRKHGAAPGSLLKICLRYARSLRSNQIDSLRKRLFRAGARSKEAMAIYVGSKIAGPFLFMFVGTLFTYGYLSYKNSNVVSLVIISIAALLGFFAPDLVLLNATSKRRLALQKALPDSLDLLVICAEAGLSLDSAFHRVAEEMGASSPELADELAITSVELNFLPERRGALENLAERIDLPAVRGLVNTLMQTERYGTPLSQALRVISSEFRDQRMLRAEEKAARLPATLTIPMILFILPTLFIVLVGPAFIDVYDHISH